MMMARVYERYKGTYVRQSRENRRPEQGPSTRVSKTRVVYTNPNTKLLTHAPFSRA